MADIVLVGGFWLGGWAWADVADRLRGSGHRVYQLSLTGLGERTGQADPQVDLETHVADVVELLEDRDLRDVLLVGHSYGALPVTGAADQVPERIRRLVYLDGGPLPAGTTLAETMAPETKAFIEERMIDGWRLPLPSRAELDGVMRCSTAGLGDAEWAAFTVGAADQPSGTFIQPVELTGAVDAVPATLVTCQFPLSAVKEMIESGHPVFGRLTGPRWTLRELPTGHWPMLSEPARTAAILDELGQE